MKWILMLSSSEKYQFIIFHIDYFEKELCLDYFDLASWKSHCSCARNFQLLSLAFHTHRYKQWHFNIRTTLQTFCSYQTKLIVVSWFYVRFNSCARLSNTFRWNNKWKWNFFFFEKWERETETERMKKNWNEM